ncbi:MAG: SDR family NAD(P)-dependent oxidoreductase, partial [Bacteroidota bacterium]
MKNKVVIITGGSSGIGKAMAFAFGNEGAKVVISARHSGPLLLVGQELSQRGIENETVVADVSIEADTRKLIETTINRFGKIDILINNAGITMRSLFEDLEDIEVIRKVMDVNFYG